MDAMCGQSSSHCDGLFRDFQPDLIHLNDGIQIHGMALLAARLSRKSAICHYRAFDPPLPIDRWLVTPGIDGWIFISQAVAEVQFAGPWATHDVGRSFQIRSTCRIR